MKERVSHFRTKLNTVKLQKIHVLPLVLVLLTLPLMLALVKVHTNTSVHAQDVAEVSSIDALLPDDDNVPDESTPNVSVAEAEATYQKDATAVDALPSIGVSSTSKPNIVVIMIDDINPIDGRFWTSKRTPNIFKYIVSKGIKFDNFYGETPLCCPGRVGFLTGQHSTNHGVIYNDARLFKPSESIATELNSVGYQTILAGKYLNNYRAIPLSKAVPPGWDRYDAIYEENGKYYKYDMINEKAQLTHYGDQPSDYSTDVIANKVVRDLKNAPVNQPVFAYVTPYAIHGSGHTATLQIQTKPAPRHKGDPRCSDIGSWKPANFNEADVSDKPHYIASLPLLPEDSYPLTKPCESLLSVDDMVGRIASVLHDEGRLNNTIFILMGDNGMGWGQHRWESKDPPFSTQIPVYIAWPAGRGIDKVTRPAALSMIDFAPTLCAAAGCTMGPYPNGQTKADGNSFLPLLKDQPLDWKRDAWFEMGVIGTTGNHWWAVRTAPGNDLGPWHYVEYSNGEKELYYTPGDCIGWNNSQPGDPCELNNRLAKGKTVPANIQALVDKLHKRIVEYRQEKGFTQHTMNY